MIEFNINSNDHLSLLLFGGTILVPLKHENGTTKAGKPKYKNIKQEVKIEGLGLNPLPEWKNKKGMYFTNEEVLKALVSGVETTTLRNIRDKDARKLAELLLEIRGLQKILGTYYEGVEENIYKKDSCVHSTFSHVLTPTGRLNCSNPNIQNQPKPPTKVTKHYTSRFTGGFIDRKTGEKFSISEGVLIVADYSQIDVRAEAEQAKDPIYTYDILNRDSHTKNLALMMKVEYEEAEKKVKTGEWKELRSKAKDITFSQQYLASANTTARSAGISKKEAQEIIDKRHEEYNILYKWHEKNTREVEKTGELRSLTGRRYRFKKYPAPDWLHKRGIKDQYSRNDLANYPTQGLATGDIVLIMLGKFWREKAIYNRDKYLLVNTVHDNVILDCKKESIEQATEDLKLLAEWKEVCYTNFKYNWSIETPIDIKQGNSWYECF